MFAERKISGTRQRGILPRAALGEARHSAKGFFVSVRHSAKQFFAERLALGKVGTWESVTVANDHHSAKKEFKKKYKKKQFAECQVLTLSKQFFYLLAPKLFVSSSYSTRHSMFKFGTFLRLFAIFL
jgi:hypothetical protein